MGEAKVEKSPSPPLHLHIYCKIESFLTMPKLPPERKHLLITDFYLLFPYKIHI